MGLLRPAILIPPGLDQPESAERLRLSLLHELAHAESLDHRFGPVANLAQAIWFFLPPVWWIRDQMKLDQEFLADRGAVDHFGTSGGYASSLVDLASSALPASGGAAPAPDAPVGGPGVASALFQRVLMLLKCPFADRRADPALVAMVGGLDAGPGHPGGLLPDAPGAGRLVEPGPRPPRTAAGRSGSRNWSSARARRTTSRSTSGSACPSSSA